jgi:hypothetical protein
MYNSLRNEVSDSCSSQYNELIEIRTLDSFCAEQSINRIDLLKTDTEGFDLDVLKGAKTMLRTHQIQFVVAEVTFYAENTSETQFFSLAEYLLRFGYQFVDVSDDDVATFNRPPVAYCNALFCCAQRELTNVPAIAFRTV